MTQTTIRPSGGDVTPSVPVIPRPRGTEPLPPGPTDHLPAVHAPVRRTVPSPTWPLIVLDTVLALGLAGTASTVGTLPVSGAVAVAVAWPLMLLVSGHYRSQGLGDTRPARVRVVAWTGVRAFVLVLALAPWLSVAAPLALAQLTAAFAVASALHVLVAEAQRPRLVLAGRPRDVREALEELDAAGRYEVVAACLTRASRVPLGDLPTYVGFEISPDVAQRHGADAMVVLPGARLSAAQVRRLHWALAPLNIELCVGTGLIDVTPNRARVVTSGGLNLVHVVPASLRGPRRWAKEVLERVAACAGLLLLWPLLLVLAVLVRLDSPGPAFYRQVRVGRDGRLFAMYKLRSMSLSADADRQQLLGDNEADGVLFKMQQDPRVTRIGHWLRCYSADELPQLWNVVRGDMSLVGPRPALPEEVARYDNDPRRRLVVKPGCTGLWQVSGRSDLSWEQSVRLDLRYVDNWSLKLDLMILVRTVSAVLTHRGAY